ncbi:N-acetylglucosamine-6-phosphate deacetylase [Brevibacillus fluminis]|uniref:N-acetylglucosamine-6-phosphate deacetylase n=1 Tax=Brevibacillus fluminis TaxID=511487 RepID=A0A3M8D3Y0_9BACL|nr:N-acetylglucosamine-6-phosphate deacetylase [Brevibacillus fluminis]RNB82786.1 N-acetylglucosamine-6-phosphate deacetylase [Brevibacillus fluminis]
MRTVYRGSVVETTRVVENGIVVTQGERILYAGEEGGYAYSGDEEIRDYSGQWIIPGLIDIHVHGNAGHDVMDGTKEALVAISKSLSSYGITGFLATTMTAPFAEIERALNAVVETVGSPELAAEVLGVHLEGPWINPKMKGAQAEENIVHPTEERVDAILRLIGEKLCVVTIAPEMPEAMAAIQKLTEQGVICSIGHSDATIEQVNEAVERGASHATHMFNGMRGLHHREPGVVGATLVHDRMTCDIIADFIHVHPNAVELVYRMKGRERLLLISDGMRAVGMPDGTYDLGGQTVHVRKCIARLTDGTLAGSTLTLNRAIGHMVETLRLSVPDAVYMAATAPAVKLGVSERKGSLEVGKDADLVVLAPDYSVRATVVKGRMVYQEGESE